MSKLSLWCKHFVYGFEAPTFHYNDYLFHMQLNQLLPENKSTIPLGLALSARTKYTWGTHTHSHTHNTHIHTHITHTLPLMHTHVHAYMHSFIYSITLILMSFFVSSDASSLFWTSSLLTWPDKWQSWTMSSSRKWMWVWLVTVLSSLFLMYT